MSRVPSVVNDGPAEFNATSRGPDSAHIGARALFSIATGQTQTLGAQSWWVPCNGFTRLLGDLPARKWNMQSELGPTSQQPTQTLRALGDGERKETAV